MIWKGKSKSLVWVINRKPKIVNLDVSRLCTFMGWHWMASILSQESSLNQVYIVRCFTRYEITDNCSLNHTLLDCFLPFRHTHILMNYTVRMLTKHCVRVSSMLTILGLDSSLCTRILYFTINGEIRTSC